jgi:uncharacterized protein (DUF4415 family)
MERIDLLQFDRLMEGFMLLFSHQEEIKFTSLVLERQTKERSKNMKKRINPKLIDSENPELTNDDFAKMRPASEVLPELFGAEIAKELLIPRGRPRLEKTKEHINIRLSPEVVEHFKSAGSGWQSRIDAALRQYIAEHP